LDTLKQKDIEVYAVWEPMLPSDARFTVGRATKRLADSRVNHFWDADGVLAKAFAPVLSIDGDAWDVYLVYDRNAEWTDTPPKPAYWQEQLGISDETKLNGPKLTSEITRMLQGGASEK
jgi:hypothetical protein